MTDDPREVGSLSEEAAKLFGALSGWARDQAGEVSEALSDLSAHATATVGDPDDHLATGSTDCTACPVCRMVHAVRQVSPELTEHLSAAMSSLAQAAAVVMAPPTSRD